VALRGVALDVGAGPLRRADRTRKDSGLRNLHDFAQNQIRLETVLPAGNLFATTATLGLSAHRTAEPKRLRLGIFAVAARLIRTGRRTMLRLPAYWPGPQSEP
jgi:hypothetical protein